MQDFAFRWVVREPPRRVRSCRVSHQPLEQATNLMSY
jgi:hypothetical protein